MFPIRPDLFLSHISDETHIWKLRDWPLTFNVLYSGADQAIKIRVVEYFTFLKSWKHGFQWDSMDIMQMNVAIKKALRAVSKKENIK